MLRILVTKKYYDNTTGTLVGYRVRNIDTGEEMDASKDAVKNMAIRGELEIVNMTLTSDGRLIGRATNKLKEKPVKKGTGRRITRVYTNGRKLACVLVDENRWLDSIGVTHKTSYKGLDLGYTFDVGFEATEKIKRNEYDNIRIVDGKPVYAPEIKKQSYKSIKDKLLKILELNGIHTTLSVGKGTEKYVYAIKIDNYSYFEDLDPMIQIIHTLIENAMYNDKIKVKYIDEDIMYVESVTGINDVRKALKAEGIYKI